MGNNSSRGSGEGPAGAPSSSVNNSHHATSRSSTLNSKSSSSRNKPPHPEHAEKEREREKQHVSSPAPLSPTTSTTHQRPKEKDSSRMGSKQSRPSDHQHHPPDANSKPVRVPNPHRGSDVKRQRGPDTQFEPSGPPKDLDYIPRSNFGLPPRLPLPIGEELHTPGSPIIDAQGSSVLHEDAVRAALPRPPSTVSSTTLEDDEIGSELPQYLSDGGRGTVPTMVFWKKAGDKVYVTGTFTDWSRKYRMNRDPSTGFLSALLQLPPGTHHVKFIVDGEMELSDELPTAVDYTNILVNYIEISVDDLPKEKESKSQDGVYPPQIPPQGTEAQDHDPRAVTAPNLMQAETTNPSIHWGRELPAYLKDVDQPEHTNRYARAARAISEFPTPPGLPLFLTRSILNGGIIMKDDSSVLTMPNHTVLNHLATSSIKNDVLATSITTRYNRKYVTTLVYKPIDDDL